MAEILIVDDDKIFSDMLADVITDMGHSVSKASTLADGLKEAAARDYNVILLDVNLPDGSGLDRLTSFRASGINPEVIIITAYGDRKGADMALNSGAWDYIHKTSSISEIRLSLSRAIQYAQGLQNRSPLPVDINLEGIVGRSDRFAFCLGRIAQAARSEANVLVTGETGTGKELFAQAIHRNSSRGDKAFVTVDCAALPPTLAESLLFGHEKGAFTGADRPLDGMLLQAHGGTLFLDEIGDISPPIQKAFLRVLQERRFRPLGSKNERESDFRVLAATNRNLDELVGSGQFRSDLLYRIRSLAIDIPPLRDHAEDIPELILFYTKRLCNKYNIEAKSFSPEFLTMMNRYNWPGNVRELVNALEWAIAAAFQEPILYPKHLPANIRLHFAYESPAKSPDRQPAGSLLPLKELRESVISNAEGRYMSDLMHITRGDLKEACRISGLSRPQLYAIMKKHNVSRKTGL
jgi:two-component system NtrC family response regulator